MTQNFYASALNTLKASKNKVCSSDSVFFESGTLNFYSYVWHFGDGDSSVFSNTWHQYSHTGKYTVTLTVTDTLGCSQILVLPGHIEVFDPEPSFTMQYYPNCVGVGVIFNNSSTNADSWHWDFGDGTYSSSKNPTHIYNTPGTYSVTLTAFKNNCSKSITLPNGIYAPNTTINFTYTQDQNCFPITITCSDLSTDVVSWSWDFGEGFVSTFQNPVHTFYQEPVNDVQLIITQYVRLQIKNDVTENKTHGGFIYIT